MGEIEDSFSLSLSLLDTHVYSGTHTHTHTQSLPMCVSLQSQLSRSSGFTPVDPFAFRPLCAPFQFESAPRWVQTILETAEYIELFSAWLPGKEISAHQEKKALRQAETRIGQFTPGGGVVSAVGEFRVAKSFY